MPHDWFVDPRPPVEVTVFRLAGSVYEEGARATGQEPLEVSEPVAVALVPDRLRDV